MHKMSNDVQFTHLCINESLLGEPGVAKAIAVTVLLMCVILDILLLSAIVNIYNIF